MQKWMSEKKDKFLVLWRKDEALYNKMDPNNSDYSYHQKIVENISNRVNMPCKINTVQLITHNMSRLISLDSSPPCISMLLNTVVLSSFSDNVFSVIPRCNT